MGADCPTDEALRQFLRGELGADRERAIDAHVGGCPACERRLGQLAGGPPWPLGLAAGRPPGGAGAGPPTLGGGRTREHATTPAGPAGDGGPPEVPGYELLGVLGA